ncbi:MAG: PilZ domain-containing protein [Candidatus Eremiobacteraeota bacterium]|nr:PilZ domain-containing protein [Candidatus Eremiobacteraeota bacterium]
MLKLFGPEIVQFFSMSGSTLIFYSAKAKKSEGELKVRISLVDYKVNRVDIPLSLLSREAVGKGFLCVGLLDMAEEHLRQLEDLLYSYAVRADLGEAARRSPRVTTGLKAVSREISGYNCVTIDISSHGVLLNCHGSLEPGQILNLTLETDMASTPTLSVRGRVLTCRENGRNRGYQVAVDYAGMSTEQTEAIEQYLRTLAGRAQGNLMQRQIADGEVTALEE